MGKLLVKMLFDNVASRGFKFVVVMVCGNLRVSKSHTHKGEGFIFIKRKISSLKHVLQKYVQLI